MIRLFEYYCAKCDFRFERIVDDPHEKVACGYCNRSAQVSRMISAPKIHGTSPAVKEQDRKNKKRERVTKIMDRQLKDLK